MSDDKATRPSRVTRIHLWPGGDFGEWAGIAIVVLACGYAGVSGCENSEVKARAKLIEGCVKLLESKASPLPEMCNGILRSKP